MLLLIAIILNVKVKEIKTKILSIKKYINMIRPYLRDIINDHKLKENGKLIQVMQ